MNTLINSGLSGSHNLRGGEEAGIKAGQVVLIKNNERNRDKWNLVIVTKPIKAELVS